MKHLLRLLFALLPGLAFAQGLLQPEGDTGYEAKQAVVAAHFMVVAANPLAVDAGVEILRSGGTAVDAAVAVQMVLGLVEPQSSGIGGGLFLMHWDEKQRAVQSYDGRETAPMAAKPVRFVDPFGRPMDRYEAIVSGLSVGTPGALRALELAHRRHGRLPWARLFEPAIKLAQEGFPMPRRLSLLLGHERYLRDDPAARSLYYAADGRPLPPGTRIVNAAYAQTLRQIAASGADAFYRGPVAADIVAAVRNHARPGDLAEEDLARYAAKERAPVCAGYRGRRLCGMGPPSSGGVTVLELLGLLERAGFDRAAPGSELALHLFAEAGRLAYADRLRYIADPDFVPQPVAGLLDPAYLDARAKLIGERSMGAARPGRPHGALALADAPDTEVAGTSHMSIVDAAGNAVAMTTTVESQFGSRIMVRGFLLNNQMTDFAFSPEFEGRPAANRVEGGKRPRSSMAPTFVFDRDGRLQAVIGSPGGAAIINYVAKALVGMLDWGLDVQAAVSLPNFGASYGPTFIERGSAYEDRADALERRGHTLNFSSQTSGLHGIERIAGGWRGGADPRREGVARGE
ncbi:MAG: gamma-glutamyltransferase [Proteobacteria bacterium]|nr:gamma-glutamyltransferase [Pseudomonadota bacterium]